MYSIYYHIPSGLSFRSFEKAPKVNDLAGLKELIDRLKWKRDGVYVYDDASKNKVSITLSEHKSAYCFELASSNGVSWKEVNDSELMSLLVSKIIKPHQVIACPEEFGVEIESV
jgi:hypothetical protein